MGQKIRQYLHAHKQQQSRIAFLQKKNTSAVRERLASLSSHMSPIEDTPETPRIITSHYFIEGIKRSP